MDETATPRNWIWWADRFEDRWEGHYVPGLIDLIQAWGGLPHSDHSSWDEAKDRSSREAVIKRFEEIVAEYQAWKASPGSEMHP